MNKIKQRQTIPKFIISFPEVETHEDLCKLKKAFDKFNKSKESHFLCINTPFEIYDISGKLLKKKVVKKETLFERLKKRYWR